LGQKTSVEEKLTGRLETCLDHTVRRTASDPIRGFPRRPPNYEPFCRGFPLVWHGRCVRAMHEPALLSNNDNTNVLSAGSLGPKAFRRNEKERFPWNGESSLKC